jgi:hypothetical protein
MSVGSSATRAEHYKGSGYRSVKARSALMSWRKFVILAAIAAVIAAAAGLWSTFDGPTVAVHVQAAEAPTSVAQ